MRRILYAICLILIVPACTPVPLEPSPTPTTQRLVLTPTPQPVATATVTQAPEPDPPTPTPESTSGPLRIAYVNGNVGSTDIYVADADGSNPVCVACEACDQAEPAWSPDGSQLVYQGNCGDSYDLWVVNADGSDRRQLTDTPDVDEREPDWSPDGTRMVYRISDEDEGRNADGTLMLMNAGANDVVSLDEKGRAPVWSPDGEQVVFMSERSGRWQLYILNLVTRTTYAQSNCQHQCRWPDWSPDGQAIIFNDTTAVDSLETNAIWTSPATSWDPELVYDGAHAGRAVWSDSGVIAYNSDNGIEVINEDGTARRTLITGDVNWAPVWSH